MKKIAFHLIAVAFVLLNVINGFTQTTSSQPFSSSYEVQKIPANPDVAQLGRFGDIPVNKYNGTANISIPIYEIDLDGLKIPIALKYNTGGVKVEQEASWVGLGWSLSDGMTITRDVNGYEDIYNSSDLNGEVKSIGWIYSKDYYFPTPPDYSANTLSEAELNEIQSIDDSPPYPIDTEPDFFTVSLPSGSCKFKLPKMANNDTILIARVTDSQNFLVLYDRVNFKFTITDPSGFVYDFSIQEYSTGFGSYESLDNYTKTGVVAGIRFPIFQGRDMISSWRVAKITSPQGRHLDFTYENGFYFSYPHFSESHDILNTNYASWTPVSLRPVIAPIAMFANMTAFNVKNLSLISGDFGSVDFVLSDRYDLVSKNDKLALSGFDNETEITPTMEPWNTSLIYGDSLIAKKVDKIIVRNRANEITKSANLIYSYFNSQWVGHEPVYNGPDPYQCDVSYIRLKLDSVTIGDQKYQFEYYQPDSLPAKYSRSVDFWGFYNGIDNYTKIPSFNRFYANHPGVANNMHDEWFEYFIKVTGGNRSADNNYGKIGILQKITYPTGGYSVLDYEGHKVTMSNVTYKPTQFLSNGSGQLRFTDLDSSANYKYSYQYMKLAKTPAYSLFNYNSAPFCDNSSSTPVDIPFTINGANGCGNNVKITVTFSCTNGVCAPSGISSPAVWLVNQATGGVTTIFNYSQAFEKPFGETLESPMQLADGTYVLKKTSWFHDNAAYDAEGKIYVPHTVVPNTSIQDEEFEVGGSRIKSVSNYDMDGSFISKSNYLYDQYVTESGKQVSNGKLMDELIFHSKGQNQFDYCALDILQNGQGCGAVLGSDIKVRTNPSAAGSHIGYSLVRDEKVDSLGYKLGQTVTQFNNMPNEYVMRDDESGAKIISGYLSNQDFHTTVNDLAGMGIGGYVVGYGSEYLLGVKPITHDYLNGSVLNEQVYNQANSLVSETINTYNPFEITASTGIGYPIVFMINRWIIHFQPNIQIKPGTHKLNSMQQLVSTTTTQFQNGIQLSSITNNYYENPAHFLMTRSATTDSKGDLYTTKYYYSKDLPTVPFMNSLVAKNQVTSPIIMERYRGSTSNPYSTLLEKVQTFYSNTNSTTGDVLPKEVFTYNLGDATGQQRVLYEKYSDYGTLIQYRKSNENIPTTLIWSHSKLLPIAQIVNAKSEQVAFTSFDEDSVSDGGWSAGSLNISSAAKKTGNKCLDTGSNMQKNGLPSGDYVVGYWAKVITGSSGTVTINGIPITITDTDWKFHEVTKNGTTSISLSNSNVYIDELRLHPVGSQMTSYTYKPLVGVTSQTDPNGNVTYFEYDASGRLMLIKDSEGNIVKKYSYNYVKSGAAE